MPAKSLSSSTLASYEEWEAYINGAALDHCSHSAFAELAGCYARGFADAKNIVGAQCQRFALWLSSCSSCLARNVSVFYGNKAWGYLDGKHIPEYIIFAGERRSSYLERRNNLGRVFASLFPWVWAWGLLSKEPEKWALLHHLRF